MDPIEAIVLIGAGVVIVAVMLWSARGTHGK